MLGNHVPRQCGIATFTSDLSDALTRQFSNLECFVVAMNDAGKRHAYPPRVRLEIAENDVDSYRHAADFLNANTVDLVCMQHEYGIFGGKAGSLVLPLLRELRMPLVTTLHTILAEPNPLQRAAMDEITRLSDRIVVMSKLGASLLQDVHGVPPEKIDFIPHGIPNVASARLTKEQLGVGGKSVILTFGLLSPDKGIEHVIDALPSVVAQFPNTVYIVLGATHPHVKERHGEVYRMMLESRAKKLGVGSHVIFHNRFVSQAELTEFLAAADIYITPYLKPEQIISGTLAYAVGSGKAVISTPYWYARELLADGRGILVPWKDPAAIARETIDLLGNDAKRLELSRCAAAHGSSMKWSAVAASYVESFERARVEHASRQRAAVRARTLAARPTELPEINLEHLAAMTDDTGIVQHAVFTVPSCESGYCLDDNARALLLMALIEDAGTEDRQVVRALASRYLGFVNHAFNPERRRFRNFMSYSRRFTEEAGSDDSHGRALWALGSVLGHSQDPGRRSLSAHLMRRGLPVVSTFTSPRAWAFALLGIDEYLHAFQGDGEAEAMRAVLANKLLELFRRARRPDWPWFEDRLTYCNARLSQALVVSGSAMGHEEMTVAGFESLEWLMSLQSSAEGFFSPIGSNGFYERTGSRAAFDQQPVEAHAAVSACLEARRITGLSRWTDRARQAFSWYLGENELQQWLYDPTTGGCRDGLHVDRLNENQGAESTLSFLLALCEMRSADRRDVEKSVESGRLS
ncbi:MAG TPA: glycosyltransferase family 4 protein [Polyangiaceae bacterium]|nr:glycosyltransferase family 4 protein [Polyangiaceae bacterium]